MNFVAEDPVTPKKKKKKKVQDEVLFIFSAKFYVYCKDSNKKNGGEPNVPVVLLCYAVQGGSSV